MHVCLCALPVSDCSVHVSLCASALCSTLVFRLLISVPPTLPLPESHPRSLSLGDKEASHFMWPYKSHLQPQSLRGKAVTAAFSWSCNMKDSSLSSWVMCVILSDMFILLQFQLSFSNVTDISIPQEDPC